MCDTDVAVGFGFRFAVGWSLSRVEGRLAWEGREGRGVVGAGNGCWEFTIEWERERVVGLGNSPCSVGMDGV